MKSTNPHAIRQQAASPAGPGWLSKYIVAGILIILVLTVFLTGQLQAPTPAEAQIQTAALVSNTDQATFSGGAFLNSTTTKHAMAFTTGSNTGGYTLDSINYGFRTIADTSTAGADLQMTLNSVTRRGQPGSPLCTLTDPANFMSFAGNTFNAPTTGTKCPILTDSTTYFIVVERLQVSGGSNITSLRTSSNAEDTGAAPGWSIADVAYENKTGRWQQRTGSEAFQIKVNGRPSNIVPGDWVLKPSGLTSGNKFRLLFLTPTGHAPTSTDIATYNTYVQGQANHGSAHQAIKPYSSTFTVVGSTTAVDARDNTSTTGTGVPIYWLNGNKVADNYADFYDGTWDDETNLKGRDGNTNASSLVWTGSTDSGVEELPGSNSKALGTSSINVGQLNGMGGPIDSGNHTPSSSALPYYALSQIFTVGNTPATGAPTVSGTPNVGEELTASTTAIEDDNGLTTPNYTYQWVRVDEAGETDITDATNSTYTLQPEDADKKVKVRVAFTDDDSYTEGPLESLPTIRVPGRDVLVRNTEQSSDGSPSTLTSSVIKRAQGFTTGSNAGGYALNSIGLMFDAIANTGTAGGHLTVTLNAETGGEPGNALCTLADPANFRASGRHAFNAAKTGTESCPTLEANRTYYAVIERVTSTSDTISLKVTTSSSEDTGSLTGWSISNDRHLTGTLGTVWQDATSEAYQIEVKGNARNEATGQPVIRASAEGAPYLFADTSGIRDPNGLPLTRRQ